MQFLVLSFLPFCSAFSSSHVTFTLGDSTYSHGDKMDFQHPASTVAVPSTNVSPISGPRAPVHLPTNQLTFFASQAPYNQAPSSVIYHPTPAPYHTTPTPYHTTPAPYHPTPAPNHPTPAPYHPTQAFYHPAPHFNPAPIRYLPGPLVISKPHQPLIHPVASKLQKPGRNCSLVTEMTTVEVCTPSFQTNCGPVELPVKTIIDKEQCSNITRTVCSETSEILENEVCVYTYQSKAEETMATNYNVTFKKECKTQMVSVCQPTAGEGYENYGEQYCKKVEQETCFNVPMVIPAEEPVMVSFPEPMMECMQKPINLPRISCEDMTEEMCTMVPGLMDDIMMGEKCEVSLGPPACEMLELSLPKQVCMELVYVPQEEIPAKP